jgi:putative acetyltransferase
MNPPVTIQRERPDHPQVVAALAALDAYLAALYPPEANHLLDVQALLAPQVRFFTARAGESLLGTAAVRLMPGEPATGGAPYGEVKRMYVDPAARGRRLGAALLQRLEQQLREEGVALALLETGAEQHAAVRLYGAAGYARRGPFGGYPDNGLSLFLGKAL